MRPKQQTYKPLKPSQLRFQTGFTDPPEGNGTKASLLETNAQRDKKETYFQYWMKNFIKKTKAKLYSSLNEALKTVHAVSLSFFQNGWRCQLYNQQFLTSIIPHISAIYAFKIENKPNNHQSFVTNQHSCNSSSSASVSMTTTDNLLLLLQIFYIIILLWPFNF